MADTEHFALDARPATPAADPFSPFETEGGTPTVQSPLEQLTAELGETPDRPPVDISVPARPGWAVRVRSDVRHEEVDGWRRRATRPTARGPELDELMWAELVVGGATIAILKNGEAVVEDGHPVTFTSRWLQTAVGATSAPGAVRRFFAVDPHLTQAAMETLRASGYDDEVRADPTKPS